METEKKYLKTIEEVSDALAAGKVVFCDDNKTKYHKDKNGFVIGENEEFGDCVGDIVEISSNPYILEPKPLEVKLWHLYEDELGERILILRKEEDLFLGGNVKSAVGVKAYYKDGRYYKEKGEPVGCNLVKEVVDLTKYFEKEPDDAKND